MQGSCKILPWYEFIPRHGENKNCLFGWFVGVLAARKHFFGTLFHGKAVFQYSQCFQQADEGNRYIEYELIHFQDYHWVVFFVRFRQLSAG